MRKIKFAIDVSWLRPGKIGGIETYVRNLLDGFLQLQDDRFDVVLIVSRDNHDTFKKYISDFKILTCQRDAINNYKMLLWTNSSLDVSSQFLPYCA